MNDHRDPHAKQEETRRLMLAIGLSMAVLMGWNMMFPPPLPQPVAPAPEPTEVAEKAPEAPEARKAPESAQVIKGADPVPVEAAAAPTQEEVVVIPVERLRDDLRLEDERQIVRFSNRGAQPTQLQLVDQAHGKIYREPGTDEERPVVDLAAGRPDFGRLSLPGLPAERVWRVVSSSAKEVVFATQAGDLEVERRWTLAPHGLAHQITLRALKPASGTAQLALSMADPKLGGSMFSGPPDLPRALCHDGTELKAELASDLKDKDTERKGAPKPHFFGVDRNFFAVLFTGDDASDCQLDLRQIGSDDEAIDVVVAHAGRAYNLPAGGVSTWSNTLYVLPKSDDLLASVDQALRDTIDFGVFKFIAQPMLWLLTFLFSLVGNYGVAIILLTFTVKILLWPITDMSFRSMARMKEVQPELSKIREKYAADKQMLAQKQMELFKERGVNPAGGCFPMLLQIPVWFALYSTLRVAVELYGSPFIPGWIDDLTLADPYYVLPVILGAVFVVQQKVQPQMSDNPQQQMMMKVMPIMMTVFMIALPAGLVVYILVNTVLGIGHQIYAIKRDAKPA